MDSSLSEDPLVPLLELSGYLVQKTLERGAFGVVYQCTALDTNKTVAVKALSHKENAKEEISALEQLKKLDLDKNNLVRFNRHFEFPNNIFLEFEKLDMELLELVQSFNRPMPLSEIQMITQQMLVALNALKSIKMVHRDIKIDNIMLVNHQLHPFKVKLIDFGLACHVSELNRGDIFYNLEGRAPEISLGLPLNEAVDMWALGCLVASMYIAKFIYSGACELGKMGAIVQLHGQPDEQLLNTGMYTKRYFHRESPSSPWMLKRKCNCSIKNVSEIARSLTTEDGAGHQPLHGTSLRPFTKLEGIAMTRLGTAGNEDTRAFVDLLKRMLQVDPGKRIAPSEALRHPFITMKYFPSDFSSGPSYHGKTVASQNDRPPSLGTLQEDLALCMNDELTAASERTTENNSHISAETLPVSTNRIWDGDQGGANRGNMGSKVRSRNCFFKKIRRFVSRLFRSIH
ncbi:homeodomain-interacting protein kinase 2-like [Cynoglossus semilaevis]|uniref:homeodomain-interacting protein kinase 2-like n=1 Tax=Cynoglossus semilaevis TaxID=244447 RepID=UPI000496A5FC|nr:homeodomain-interacting protein kinase 2-like [Cynoglossus semilaevis]